MRRALSSIYGFIVIYLLALASFQVIGTAISSQAATSNAYQQAQELGQARSLEHLTLTIWNTTVSVANDGSVPSMVSYLILRNTTRSTVVPVGRTIPMGSSISLGIRSGSSVSAVTSLGNVFKEAASTSVLTNVKGWKGVGGPDVDMQLYQNPYDFSRFFVSSNSRVYEFSSVSGNQVWSFDSGLGEVTDILPLSNGYVYVADGYLGSTRTATFYELNLTGGVTSTYSMRLLRLFTTIEIQYADGDVPPFPIGSEPVQRGVDGLYAAYDGWFFSSSGPSGIAYPSDSFNLAASDSSRFYVYSVQTDTGGNGCSQPYGNSLDIRGYSADSSGASLGWSTLVYLNTCNTYPESLVSSSANAGIFASLFAEDYYDQPNYYGTMYSGANPFLVVLTDSGNVLYSARMDHPGYSSVATDGSNIYLSIPASKQIEKLSLGSGTTSTIDAGGPVQQLSWGYDSLFAVSGDQVNIYDSSMNLKKAISFAPYSFYSLSNSKPLEPRMISPSFLVLNSTSYAALVRNSTGFGTLLVGRYSP